MRLVQPKERARHITEDQKTDDWGISDDQAEKVKEALSKKSIRPEDAVQKAVKELARDIAIIEPDPLDWGWWIFYLVGKLEEEAKGRGNLSAFDGILISLIHYLQDHNKPVASK